MDGLGLDRGGSSTVALLWQFLALPTESQVPPHKDTNPLQYTKAHTQLREIRQIITNRFEMPMRLSLLPF